MASRREISGIAVRIDPELWAQEVERLRPGSPARVAAERERGRLLRDGLPRDRLIGCDAVGPDGTRLPGLVKAYVPISAEPASQRPYGFVFSVGADDGGQYLALIAFGERHPPSGTRAVYERAHKRVHGLYPDQERTRPDAAVRHTAARSPSRAPSRQQERGGLEL